MGRTRDTVAPTKTQTDDNAVEVASTVAQRRRFLRVPLCGPVQLVAETADGGFRYYGHVLDVSAGGCALQLGVRLDDGTPVALDLELRGCRMRVLGHVKNVRTRPRGWRTGIEFDHLSPARQATLATLVNDIHHGRALVL
ncbi:MAG: PilZ domain-containing protein [Actinomycetota bacterium]